jgi:glutamyl-tRNA synthetase
LADDVVPYIEAKGYPVPPDKKWREKMVATLQERAKTLVELVEMAHFYLSDDIRYDDKAAKKFFTSEIRAPLSELIEKLDAAKDFDEKSIETAFTEVLQRHNLQLGKLAQPVRVALTGTTVSPGIYEVLAVLGKERAMKRLREGLEKIPE